MLDRSESSGAGDAVTRLSPREMQVLDMTSRGMTNGQVAYGLQVTVHAVKFHLASVYRKLGVTNRTQAAAVYLTSSTWSGESDSAG